MLSFVHWLSATPASLVLRDSDWLAPTLQSIHIVAIAMVMSSVLMIDLRVLQVTRSQTIADTAKRFQNWIWSGLAILAVTGMALILAEPQRTLPNISFHIKIGLLILAAAATLALQRSLRHDAEAAHGSASQETKLLAIVALLLWCGVAAAGRFIAYTQPV